MSRQDHEALVEAAKAAVQAVHGDTSVSQQQTIDSLDEVRDEIDVMISQIKNDMARDAAPEAE